jgi:glycosyltransferase involved in cell wall biosynthesis
MTALEILRRKPVYFYVQYEILPYGQGSSMRRFTNLRAYLDLGFEVKIIQFRDVNEDWQPAKPLPLPKTEWTKIDYRPAKPNLFQRLAFYAGFPRNALLDLMYPIRTCAVRQVAQNEQSSPGAIHHFEYDALASSAAAFKNLNSVWSCHDVSSTRIALVWEMRKEFMDLAMSDCKRRIRRKRLKQSENSLARSNKLVLNIAEHEHEEFRHQRNYRNAELFPMSWPDETVVQRRRGWMGDGKLRLLHLGSVDGFVGYDSLRFILEEVFPLLPAGGRGAIELLVAGKMGSTKFSEHIRSLSKAYPQVKFLGYVEDLRQIYGEADLQVVGSLRATGLRTRIVESFVYGVPVLSTVESARGLSGLANGVNIMLAADAPIFARELASTIRNPGRLQAIAAAARLTYLQIYSRDVAAQKLAACLEKYF